jgi:predicted nucleic acid-binding Zn ribbon protein
MTPRKHCQECDKPLVGRRNKKFCDERCSRKWNSKQWREHNPKTIEAQLAVGTIGSMNVMRVMLDLVAKGYNVYRAAFEAMPFELVLVKGDPTETLNGWRVKVTTGHRTATDLISHRKLDPAEYGYDVLAVVVGNEIVYEGAIL